MSRINRTFFFGHLQQRLYPLGLDKSQIDGHEAVLDDGKGTTLPRTIVGWPIYWRLPSVRRVPGFSRSAKT
jgi:hypothetical protein